MYENFLPGTPDTIEEFEYNPDDAIFLGLVFESIYKPLRTIHLGKNQVVYSFRDDRLTFSGEKITEMVAEQKPMLLEFLTKLYGKEIDNLVVRGERVILSGGYPGIGSFDIQDFRNNEMKKYGISCELGADKLRLYDVGIDPRVAMWLLRDEYESPITVNDIDNGMIVIESDGEVVIPEWLLKERVAGLESNLMKFGKYLYPGLKDIELFGNYVLVKSEKSETMIDRDQFEVKLAEFIRTKIEYLSLLNDIQYIGVSLLEDASIFECIEALERVQEYAESSKPFNINGLHGLDSIIRTFEDRDGRMVTDILPFDVGLEDVEEIGRLGIHQKGDRKVRSYDPDLDSDLYFGLF